MNALFQKKPNPTPKPPAKTMISTPKPLLSKSDNITTKPGLPNKDSKFVKQELSKDIPPKDNNSYNPALNEWQENRKKWLQKTAHKNDGNLIKSEQSRREISIEDYGEIEKIIRAITGPYKPFKNPIKLGDMVEILDDIWEEDNE